jgi:hypothetical protein
VAALRIEPSGSEAALYARSCKQISEKTLPRTRGNKPWVRARFVGGRVPRLGRIALGKH